MSESSVRPGPDLSQAHPSPLSASHAEPPRPPALKGIDSLGFVMDVPVAITVELGRRTVKIAEVLRLGPGSVLELEKANGEPLDLYVNDRLIARGEAVVIGERYGIRLTEVVINDDTRRGGTE
ncbi:MAG TPA: flagellar motor switch protein FliN [Polyangiaceae bacterium]